MVGVGDEWQLSDATNAGGLLGEFAEGDQGEVGGTQHLQRGDRTAEDPDLKAQVRGNACRHRVEDRCGVIALVGGEQFTEVAAQILMGKPGHISSTNTKEWKGLSKSVNAEDAKGYHATGETMMTNLSDFSF
ncbi:hypothetical protein D3C73_1285470 [compost metagenome]